MSTEFFNRTVRVTNSAVDQFNAIKPYHTHLLEVVERYVFSETITVNVTDVPLIRIIYAPKPDCTGEGWGTSYDSALCGYDPSGCCTPFTCEGGFGGSWDNSNLFAQYPVQEVDYTTNTLTVQGDRTIDTHLRIIGYPSQDGNQITVETSDPDVLLNGDPGGDLGEHVVFEIVSTRHNLITAVDLATNSVVVESTRPGDFATSIIIRRNGEEHYATVLNVTQINSDEVRISLDPGTYIANGIPDVGGTVISTTTTANAGTYLVSATEPYTSYDTGVLTITIEGEFPSPTEQAIGSIVLRTALVHPRVVTLHQDVSTIYESRVILTASYDAEADETSVVFADELPEGLNAGLEDSLDIQLHGHDAGPGYDGYPNCIASTNTLIGPILNENLTVEVIETELPPAFRLAQSVLRFSAPTSRTVVVRGTIEIEPILGSSNARFSSWISHRALTHLPVPTAVELVTAGSDASYVTLDPVALTATITGDTTGHTLEWQQTAGDPVMLTDGDTASASFIAGATSVEFRFWIDRFTPNAQFDDIVITVTSGAPDYRSTHTGDRRVTHTGDDRIVE